MAGAPPITYVLRHGHKSALSVPLEFPFHFHPRPDLPRRFFLNIIFNVFNSRKRSRRPLRRESRRIRNEIKRRVFMLIGRKSSYRARHLSSRPLFIAPEKKENLIKRNYVACALIMSLVDKR